MSRGMDVSRDNVENIYPLSPLQQGLLFHALADEGPAYFQQLSYDVRGPLDVDVLEECWNELFRRHPILRTAFVHEGADEPLQVVLRKRLVELTRVDLRGLPAEEQERQRREHREADRARGFDLARDTLMRVRVLELGEGLHEVVWSHHHILLDGWSLGILQGELGRLLEARATGGDAALPPARPFVEYVRWLKARPLEDGDGFWRGYLAGYRGVAAVPRSVRPGPPGRGRREFRVPILELEALRGLAGRAGVTLNTVLHALWGVLLARYNRSRDVVFGAAVSGRPPELPGVESMVGLFVNTVPVRVRLDPGVSFEALLPQVQRAALDCEPFHTHPLARTQARTSVLPGWLATHLTLENYPLDAAVADHDEDATARLRVEAARVFEETHFDFDLQFLPDRDGMRVQMGYRLDLHGPDQAAWVERHLRAGMAAVIQDASVAVEDLDLRCGGEDGVTAPASAPSGTLGDAFLAQVAARPDAMALSGEAGGLTYGELAARARTLAGALRDAGVGPEVPVALLLGRGPETVVAILATLLAGGFYVPIDPSSPTRRVAFVLEDSGARIVLTDREQRATVAEAAGAGVTVLLLDGVAEPGEVRQSIEGTTSASLAEGVPLDPENAAYMIYTSGTTGRPKGVVVTHRNVLRLFDATALAVSVGPEDVWTVFHSYAFDFSVWEVFGALLHGGRMVMVPFWVSRDPSAFWRLVVEERVTVLSQTPSAFRLLLEAAGRGVDAPALRYLVFGGEALDPAVLAPWFKGRGDQRPVVVNMYGITETTVHVTWRRLSEDSRHERGSLVGRPLGDLSVALVDDQLRPQPLGAPGEILVGGAGVARGYHGRPALTAERFVPDPSSPDPGARRYRSGDLARRVGGGELEYLGRIDQQVKVRGFRIELGEVEAALRDLPQVADAVVVTCQGPGGEPELAAYVVPVGDEAVDPSALRRGVSKILPESMVPTHVLAIPRLPLTANGKLDLGALPDPRPEPEPEPASPAAAGTPEEEALVRAWSAVLGHQRFGIQDRFLEVGGDSIKAIQVTSRLLREGFRLGVRDLFLHPTIAALAPRVRPAETSRSTPDRTGPVPCTPIQARFFAENTRAPGRFLQGVVLRGEERLSLPRLDAALAAVVQHHEAFRLRFLQREPGRWSQELVRTPGTVPLEEVDLRGVAAPAEVAGARAAALYEEVDLATGPLARGLLVHLPRETRLYLVVHHLIVDGLSWRVLIEDLTQAYQEASAQGATLRAPRTAGFADWAGALVDYARSEALLDERPVWEEVVRTPAPPLPSVRVHGSNRFGDATSVTRTLDEEDTARLVEGAHRAYGTNPEDLLLVALARALHGIHGRRQTLVELEGHGREAVVGEVDVGRTMGWFTSLYPFRLVLPNGEDLGYQIKVVKESLRQVPHRGIGYGVLRYLGPGREDLALSSRDRPTLRFNYLGQFRSGQGAGTLTAQPDASGVAVHPDEERPCELDVSAMVLDGTCTLEVGYSRARLAEEDAEAFGAAWVRELRAVLDHCRGVKGTQLTPSDLTYSAIALDELEELFE